MMNDNVVYKLDSYVSNMIPMGDQSFEFEEFLESFGLSIASTKFPNAMDSIVEYGNSDIVDVKVVLYETKLNSYIAGVSSEDFPAINYDCTQDTLDKYTYKTAKSLSTKIAIEVMRSYNFNTLEQLNSHLVNMGYGTDEFDKKSSGTSTPSSSKSTTGTGFTTIPSRNVEANSPNVTCDLPEYKWSEYMVAVYGSLRPTLGLNSVLDDCDHVSTTIIKKHVLYDGGAFPYAVFTGNYSDKIVIDIYRVPYTIMAELDRIEGEGSHYDRVKLNGTNINIYLKHDLTDLDTMTRVPDGSNGAADWREYYTKTTIDYTQPDVNASISDTDDDDDDLDDEETIYYSESEMNVLIEAFKEYATKQGILYDEEEESYWKDFNAWLESDESEEIRDYVEDLSLIE